MKFFDLKKYKSTEFIIEYRAIFLLLIAVIYASFFVPYFATERNITQVLTQFSIEGIIAVGLTILMIAWGIDLSVGSTMAFGGLVFALTQNMGITIAAIFGVLAGIFASLSALYILSWVIFCEVYFFRILAKSIEPEPWER